jgi:hypothetical protein
MSMETPKGAAVLDPRVVESRAEVLLAMDVLMKHLNDEDDQMDWLVNGVPDGAPPLRMTPEQLDYYSQFADDFEEMVKVFARIVKRVCFKTRYEPKGFC